MSKFLIANFKMNGLTSEVNSYFETFWQHFHQNPNLSIIFCPPFTSLSIFSQNISKENYVFLGAQNCSEHEFWAFTGEISAKMLSDLGVQFVILWHQERRKMGENSAILTQKIQRILEAKMTPIVCFGDNLPNASISEKVDFLKQQIDEIFLHFDKQLTQKILIAYEPIFAIGIGKTPNPNEIDEIFAHLKKSFQNAFLYGGSINKATIEPFLQAKNIDGFLVGNACLDAKHFAEIGNTYAQ